MTRRETKGSGRVASMGSMPGLLLSVINVTWAFTVSHDLEMFLIALSVSLLHSLRVKYLVARGEAFGASELPFIKGPCVPGTIQGVYQSQWSQGGPPSDSDSG